MAHAAAVHDQPVTAEELLRMPDDGFRRELVRGELREMTPAGHHHGRFAANLAGPLIQHVRARGLGAVYVAETGFRLASDPDTVRVPDVAFLRSERVRELEETEGYALGAPDLAIEVVSPGDSSEEVQEKVLEYLAAGCRMVVVVHPRHRAATVYRSHSDVVVLRENDLLDGADVVPGWKLPLREIFE